MCPREVNVQMVELRVIVEEDSQLVGLDAVNALNRSTTLLTNGAQHGNMLCPELPDCWK